MGVILSPSLVILSPFASLRINSAKNLIASTESTIEILRLPPQNDITTQSQGRRVTESLGRRVTESLGRWVVLSLGPWTP